MPYDSLPEVPDEDLLARFAKGDAGAARSLTLRHAPRALAQARRMLRDEAEAEDVAQEAMLRMWKIAPDWRPGEAKLSTWLYRVTANLATDRLRRRRSVGLDDVAEPVDEAPSAEASLQAADRSQALHAALAELPERQRVAVTMRHLEERTNPEIADILDLSVDAVESLIARGRRALASRLSGRAEQLGLS